MSLYKNEITSFCIQGDLPGLINFLQTKQDHGSRQFLKRVKRRFYNSTPHLHIPTKDPWIYTVLSSYYSYYTDVLTRTLDPKTAEQKLASSLSKAVLYNHESDIDVIEQELSLHFQNKGYQFLGGVTAPFRGPYIWKTTVPETYNVHLPYGEQTLTVHFLHDFIMAGWLHFASLGLASAGGWAQADGLYCLYKRYKHDLDNESFQVSYLKHEAQHALDYRMFPNLDSADLEYRAKLVELIGYSDHTRLLYFIHTASNDPQIPHAYAAYRIIAHLSKYIFGKDYVKEDGFWLQRNYNEIQICARELLDHHSDFYSNESPST